jgi:hypothetical protein
VDKSEILRTQSAVSFVPRSPKIPSTTIDPHHDLWNTLFGDDTYTVYWADFILKLNLSFTSVEEKQFKSVIDCSETGRVTHFRFIEFLKGFGPLDKCKENVGKLTTSIWFHGYISQADSLKLLKPTPTGTFLVRFGGPTPGTFIVDYVMAKGTLVSVRLTNHSKGGFEVQEQGGSAQVFRTIEDFIIRYVKLGVLKQCWRSVKTRSLEAEQKTNFRPPTPAISPWKPATIKNRSRASTTAPGTPPISESPPSPPSMIPEPENVELPPPLEFLPPPHEHSPHTQPVLPLPPTPLLPPNLAPPLIPRKSTKPPLVTSNSVQAVSLVNLQPEKKNFFIIPGNIIFQEVKNHESMINSVEMRGIIFDKNFQVEFPQKKP